LRFVEGITDEGLVGLVKNCGQSLVSLAVATCVWLTDASLHAVGSHCPNLEILSLESDRIQNGGVISVAKGCRLLKTLKLQCVGASDEALDAIGSFCLLLEILSLSNFGPRCHWFVLFAFRNLVAQQLRAIYGQVLV
jgi:F-box and leucine-rich repeat protein 2/20